MAVRRNRLRLKKVVAAFAVAPLGGAGAVAAIGWFIGMFSLGLSADVGAVVAETAFVLFVIFSILGYAVAIILGIPGYLIFRRMAWVRRAHWVLLCAILGAIAGSIWPVVALLAQLGINNPTTSIGGMTVAGALVGTVSGLVFAWIIKVEAPRADEIAATFD
jgi:hypothetical protein